jgi:hypothetical protein
MKRLRELAATKPTRNALSEWTVPVLPSDLAKLLKRYDSSVRSRVLFLDGQKVIVDE